jgi:hypothetical protein
VLYVHESITEEFNKRFSEAVDNLKFGCLGIKMLFLLLFQNHLNHSILRLD